MAGRYYELDAARGAALILMIIYHVIFCLYFFTDTVKWFDPQTYSGAPIAFLFIFIAGISLVLSAGKKDDLVKTAKKLFFRGLYVLAFAVVVSVVTFLVYPQGWVMFGVLHLIGVSTILAIPFVVLKVKTLTIFLSGAVITALTFVVSLVRGPEILIPLGITHAGFYTIDYEPLIPWFGIVLLGVALGSIIYKNGKRCKLFEKLGSMPKFLSPLCFIGRHTLIVYMIHVPIIILVICIIFGFDSLGIFF